MCVGEEAECYNNKTLKKGPGHVKLIVWSLWQRLPCRQNSIRCHEAEHADPPRGLPQLHQGECRHYSVNYTKVSAAHYSVNYTKVSAAITVLTTPR